MVERVSFSAKEQSLEDIAFHHSDVLAGIFQFFSGQSAAFMERYADARLDDVREKSIAELNFTSSLSVLSSVEAAIRVDYLQRVYGRWRDPLSREMKVLYQEKANKARLEDELIGLWRSCTGVSSALLGEVIGAIKYRHWLAHGRYWTPKLGRRYDYETVYDIAQEFLDAMYEYNISCNNGQSKTL
jgi:hypothetical protein